MTRESARKLLAGLGFIKWRSDCEWAYEEWQFLPSDVSGDGAQIRLEGDEELEAVELYLPPELLQPVAEAIAAHYRS